MLGSGNVFEYFPKVGLSYQPLPLSLLSLFCSNFKSHSDKSCLYIKADWNTEPTREEQQPESSGATVALHKQEKQGCLLSQHNPTCRNQYTGLTIRFVLRIKWKTDRV
jgi:hypothetical protein